MTQLLSDTQIRDSLVGKRIVGTNNGAEFGIELELDDGSSVSIDPGIDAYNQTYLSFTKEPE